MRFSITNKCWAVVAATMLLLPGCGGHGQPDGDPAIDIDTHNCFPSCQSFWISLVPSGEAKISVFAHTRFVGMHTKQVSPEAYQKLHALVEELDVAGLEQASAKHPLACVSSREPLLRIRSERQLDTHYYLWLSCSSHRETALKLAAAALALTESEDLVEEWPLPAFEPR